jgi:hypothetical protein
MVQIFLERKVNKGFMSEIYKGVSVIDIDAIASRTEPHISLRILQAALDKLIIFR